MIVRSLALWALFVVCASHAAAQSYQYDERGRLIRASYSDCSTIRYFYDAAGNRTERIVLAGDGSCAGNQPPVAANDTIVLAPGATGLFDLLAAQGGGSADADPNGDPIRIISVSQGSVPATSSGALGVQLQDDRRQVRITAPGVNGSYGFSYRIEDAFGLTDEAQVQLTVQTGGSNTPPVFTSAESASVSVGASGVFYTATASDANTGDTLSFLALTGADANRFSFNAATGGLSLAPGTPAGTYNVILRVTDSKSPAVSMALLVTVASNPPSANPDTAFAQAGQWIGVDVLQNDTGSNLELVSVQADAAGNSAEVLNGLARVRASEASGQATFTYTVRDQQSGMTDAGTLTLDVNRRPGVPDLSRIVQPNQSVVLNVIAQATDPDGDPVVLTNAYINPIYMNGLVERINNNTAIRFTAPASAGVSVVSFRVEDGRGGTRNYDATMTVQAPPNTCPVARNDAYVVSSGSASSFPVLSNDTDQDGDALSLASVGSVSGGGSASRSGNQINFQAPTGPATSTFSYTASDGQCSRSATVTVTTNAPANRAPTLADDWDYVISGGARLINVLANDSDPDGDTLYLVSVSNGSSGSTARIVGGQVEVMPGTASSDSFTYTVRDRQSGGLQASAVIRVTINRHPHLVSETYSLSPGETRTLDVLSNDSDPDGQSLRIYGVTGVTGGASAVPTGGGGSVSYTAPMAAGTYAFRYWVDDYAGGVSHMESYVIVTSPNQFPVTQPDYFTVYAGETVTLNGILSNDSDPDGDPLTIERVYAFEGGGSGSVNPGGTSVTYTAPLTQGSARFGYVAIDGRGGYQFNWVNISVLPPVGNCGGVLCLPEP